MVEILKRYHFVSRKEVFFHFFTTRKKSWPISESEMRDIRPTKYSAYSKSLSVVILKLFSSPSIRYILLPAVSNTVASSVNFVS